ncbi:uncharacterized protein TNCT_625801 [Trichonephila clavata]|uniref:Uncharacterized protein n=1 Tax=Trichonephila clavata TaxID=2740835 RepID=A0A8X6M342_TRICU|nr:uncharacterized protein TNCT_625801 [Trichonephila clavata]
MQKLFPETYSGVLDLHQDNKNWDPKGYLTENLLNLFPQVFAVLKVVVYEDWFGYVEVSRQTMASSPEEYISILMTMCHIEKKRYQNIYDRFLIVLSLVLFTQKMISDTTHKPFHRLIPQILIVFFENVLREDFYKRGGWNRLEKYILSRKYTEYYEECLSYKLILKDLPDHLKQRILHSFSLTEAFYCKIGSEGRRFSSLTREVMSYVDPSLLNELSSPELNEQWILKQPEESDSSTTTTLKDSLCKVPDESKFYVLCSNKVEELEWTLKDLLSIFELLDTK